MSESKKSTSCTGPALDDQQRAQDNQDQVPGQKGLENVLELLEHDLANGEIDGTLSNLLKQSKETLEGMKLAMEAEGVGDDSNIGQLEVLAKFFASQPEITRDQAAAGLGLLRSFRYSNLGAAGEDNRARVERKLLDFIKRMESGSGEKKDDVKKDGAADEHSGIQGK